MVSFKRCSLFPKLLCQMCSDSGAHFHSSLVPGLL